MSTLCLPVCVFGFLARSVIRLRPSGLSFGFSPVCHFNEAHSGGATLFAWLTGPYPFVISTKRIRVLACHTLTRFVETSRNSVCLNFVRFQLRRVRCICSKLRRAWLK